MITARISGSDSFTGNVQACLLRTADAESAPAMYSVTFAPEARTRWHTHPHGQGLFITAGRARIQIDGQPVAEYGPGDFVWIPPNVRHWHGAGPEGSMTHLAAQQAATDGSTVTWFETVSDATYTTLHHHTDKDDL